MQCVGATGSPNAGIDPAGLILRASGRHDHATVDPGALAPAANHYTGQVYPGYPSPSAAEAVEALYLARRILERALTQTELAALAQGPVNGNPSAVSMRHGSLRIDHPFGLAGRAEVLGAAPGVGERLQRPGGPHASGLEGVLQRREDDAPRGLSTGKHLDGAGRHRRLTPPAELSPRQP